MESVRLEMVAAVAVQPLQVMQLVQRLKGVPEDALCEIQDVSSRKTSCEHGVKASGRMIQTQVHLSCEPQVAAFLCQQFGAGMLLAVSSCMCDADEHLERQEYECSYVPGASRKSLSHIRCYHATSRRVLVHAAVSSKDPVRPPTLPIEKVIMLIEFLGDHVVDARDAYERYADEDMGAPHRMTLLGLVKALEQLCANEWNVNQQQRKEESRAAKEAPSGLTKLDRAITVTNLRHLLSRMIATNSVAVGALPSSTTAPFLSYTDFLACYVAFLNLLHASTRAWSGHSKAGNQI